jgi:integrase
MTSKNGSLEVTKRSAGRGRKTKCHLRSRNGFWHYRFIWKGLEYTGNTGLAAVVRLRKEALEFAVAQLDRLRARENKARLVPFDTAAGEFISWCETTEYRSKHATAARLKTSCASLVEFFGPLPVQQLDAAAIERYKTHRLEEHRVRDITLRHDLHALSVFFRKYAIKQGWADTNPVLRVTIPSDREAVREHVITAAEEKQYFEIVDAMYAARVKTHKKDLPNLGDIARLMLEQGCRPEELYSARASSFDPAAKTLRIESGKTRAARRTLNLTEVSLEILKRRGTLGSEWLFPTDRAGRGHLAKLTGIHNRACNTVKPPLAFVLYDFRHTFATRMIEAGNPVAIVAAIMGHSGLRTIHRYVHPTSEAQKEAMERFEAAANRRKLKVVG